MLEPPRPGESLFLYVTDGAGSAGYNGDRKSLNQYDVILGRPDSDSATLRTARGEDLHFLSFYLPSFLP